ncbi:hypothetical protein ACFFX0_31675 [Citricoccus parietis]|uniref:Uncharacterized protein n=1 Tax=Citricoccus parietis TaxID=592307 RepID=A0ABV5G946_9MICC
MAVMVVGTARVGRSEPVNRPGSDGDSFYWIPTKVWSVRFVA